MVKIAAIEGGGTTWLATISEHSDSSSLMFDNFLEMETFPTESPEITLSQIRAWLNSRTFDCIGIASFGPVDAKIGSLTFGYITSTPKPGWRNTDVLGGLGIRDEFKNIPFRFDTDVNAPALAEFKLNPVEGRTSSAYITVGTGIGVGLVINGNTVKGLMHPEAGHIMSMRSPDDTFPGTCPFHGSCIEGMCSTGALTARACLPSSSELPSLPDSHPLWSHTAFYLAQLCVSLIMIASPERIVLGGGVMNRECLYPLVRQKTLELLNQYIHNEQLTEENIHNYILPSKWGSRAGIVGAAYLGLLAYQEQQSTP